MNNISFQSSAETMSALLETFFKIEPMEHIRDWRWHQYTKREDGFDAVMQAAKDLAQLRKVK